MSTETLVVFDTNPMAVPSPPHSSSKAPDGPGVHHSSLGGSFVVDDSAFRHEFGGHTTTWSAIVTTTVDWYRAHTTAAKSSHSLVEATTVKETS